MIVNISYTALVVCIIHLVKWCLQSLFGTNGVGNLYSVEMVLAISIRYK